MYKICYKFVWCEILLFHKANDDSNKEILKNNNVPSSEGNSTDFSFWSSSPALIVLVGIDFKIYQSSTFSMCHDEILLSLK